MLLARVAEISRGVSGASRRLEKIELLSGLLRQLEPEETPVVIPWLSGSTRQGRIGIGYAALANASAVPAASPSLAVADLDSSIQEILSTQGAGSAERRNALLHRLFERATEAEQDFIRRLLAGELRQGALEGVMIEAVARAAGVSAVSLRRAAMMAGELSAVAQAALLEGEAGLDRFAVQLLRPVQPMLAQTAEDVEEALAELGEAAFEYKLDGARIQAHRSGDEVVVFSRRLNDVTAAVPEVVEAVLALPGRDLILDGEVIALAPGGRPQPFQVTMRRFGRKLDVDRVRRELPLTPFWFDLLHADGGSLLDEPQARRFSELAKLAPEANLVPHHITSSLDDARAFAREALLRGHEGVMAKATSAPYAAGRRGQSWLKIKQARTLDLVILAAEWGSGRRRGWLSNLHLGARDTDKGGFAMLGKTFKGLTDEMLAWQTAELLKIEVARDRYTVYVEPRIVAEIAFNEIQASPRYASGLALRFARVKRFRPDKTAADADTFETVQALASP